MKRIAHMLIAAVTAFVAADAQPKAEFTETIHDFGAFDENDGNVTCKFRFVNTGDEPLSVISARATCGCTTPAYTRTAVEPGDTGTVTVTYNPTGRPGRFSKKVYIDFNTDPPRETLMIKGVVIGASNTLRGRYPVDAGRMKLRNSMVLFGDVKKGRAKTSFLEVYNASPDTITPQWTGVPGYLRITSPVESIPPGEQTSYSFYLTTDRTDTYGIITDSVMLSPTAGAEDSFKVDIVAIVEEDFSTMTPGQRAAAPVIKTDDTSLDFDRLTRNNGPVTRTFTVRNDGKSDLMLRRVYTTDPGVTVTADRDKVKKGKTATITVTVDPAAIPSEILNARISIIANDPENPTTIVRAVGQID